MKKFIVDTGKKKYTVEANDAKHAVDIVKKIDDESSQLQINDAGRFDLKIIELENSSELTLTKLIKDVKMIVHLSMRLPIGQRLVEITNGRFDAGILRLQLLMKDDRTNKFYWMELPIAYRLNPKAQLEIDAKLKQFAGKQIYKDKSIATDSFEDAKEFIKDAGLSVLHYKSPISDRQSILILKDRREIYTFLTAAEAIAFANKILSIAAKLPK